jgi:hypothetical protein
MVIILYFGCFVVSYVQYIGFLTDNVDVLCTASLIETVKFLA